MHVVVSMEGKETEKVRTQASGQAHYGQLGAYERGRRRAVRTLTPGEQDPSARPETPVHGPWVGITEAPAAYCQAMEQ